MNGKLASTVQLAAAYIYFKDKPKNSTFNAALFEKTCGVGIVVTTDEIKGIVEQVIQSYAGDAMDTKGPALKGKMYCDLRRELPWADGKIVSKIFTEMFASALKLSSFGKKTNASNDDIKISEDIKDEDDENETMERWMTGRDLEWAHNSSTQLQTRTKWLSTNNLPSDTFLTRFPPEPNGFLHIGHCKAMTFNFTLAEKKGGHCYLRFDDTNPATEKQIFIDNIISNTLWMGFKPWKITYSSQYFPELYEYALKLIKDGNAYVCFQSKAEMEESRNSFKTKDPRPSPWRNINVNQNLIEFERMRVGYYKEGECCLRMKGDYLSCNPNMWDHVAYRIKFIEHPMSKREWCIYPTYDYTHCIVDSIEYISASCCTLEFENRRESYFWLLDVLNIYKPAVWEYSRLNITYNVISKRKLLKLVTGGFICGWNDPRLLTINGLMRRGYTAEILRYFCNLVGVTRKDNYISPKLLESCARKLFDGSVGRAMAVVCPLKVVIVNYVGDGMEDIECPLFPQDRKRGMYCVKFGRVVHIDRSDFSLNPRKKYYGLAVGRTVRLHYAYNITCNEVVRDVNGEVVELLCTYIPESRFDTMGVKKGNLTWVAECNAIATEFRLYSHLFKSEFPESHGGDSYLEDIDPKSEIICSGFVDKYVVENDEERYQFERLGYFVKDVDYTSEHPVFNRTVTLRESSDKKSLKKRGKKQNSPKARRDECD